MTRRLLAALGTTLLLTAALAACATPAGSDGAVEPDPSASAPAEGDGSTDSDDTDMDAAWLDGGRMIGLLTYGSSSCVPTAVYGAVGEGTIEVELFDDPAAACTRDLVPRVSPLDVTGAVDPTQDLEIVVTGGYSGDTDLDGLPADQVGEGATNYEPSAGWTDEDGRFVILTWGSSSCVPELESVEATGATEITATFAAAAADQVCTADMAPRTLVAAVEGIDDESGVELVLTGGEFTGQRTLILGG